MEGFRKLIIFLLLGWLALFLVLFSIGAVSYITILNPSFAESRLESSGFYEDFADNAVEVISDNLEGNEREVEAATVRLEPVFQRVLTPRLVQSSTEKVLNGVTDWLNGETELPRFLVDTEDIRADLTVSLVDYLNRRLADLPVCPAGADLGGYDPFTAECSPPGGLDQNQLQAWADELTAEMPLLGRKQVTEKDIIDDPDARAWRTVPQAYFWGKVAVGLFFGLLVLISVLVLVVGSNRATSFRRLAHVSLFNALVLLVGGGVIALFLGGHGLNFIASGEPERVVFAETVVIPVLRSFAHGIGAWLMGFGAIFLFFSITFYVVSHYLKHRQAPVAQPGAPSAQAPQQTSPPQAATPAGATPSSPPSAVPPSRTGPPATEPQAPPTKENSETPR